MQFFRHANFSPSALVIEKLVIANLLVSFKSSNLFQTILLRFPGVPGNPSRRNIAPQETIFPEDSPYKGTDFLGISPSTLLQVIT